MMMLPQHIDKHLFKDQEVPTPKGTAICSVPINRRCPRLLSALPALPLPHISLTLPYPFLKYYFFGFFEMSPEEGVGVGFEHLKFHLTGSPVCGVF
ncbi:hypothetical protein CDAR_371791 [Caerostris darwini]|uniref:Uncharacterized protein n=1 Tax=Caerostris darwini TaxID=1538125 RepID=A0AAV4U0W5_9ARAC|nr:hypothetical protein CDAR_371791 [Caerostris darwini]